MQRITQWIRLWQIQRTLLRHNLLELVIPENSWLHPIVTLSKCNPWYWGRDKSLNRGQRLRLALQELGPFFIKFGQLLSTRRDIVPDDMAEELVKLQDKVAPFTYPDVATVVTRSLGRPANEVFTQLDPQPLASASIAQVHSATLPNGREVVIKILRPNIEKIIARDVYLLKNIARHVARYLKQGARLLAVVNEIEQTIYAELDLLHEAANMSRLRRNCANLDDLKIPDVIWSLTRRDMLVMERIHGIPLSEITRMRENGVDLKALSENIIRLFFLQVFEHGFFHADMHAGNLFLAHAPINPPHLIMVDFGIVGSLNADDLSYLAQNLDAFLKGDYRRVAELHVESGWVPADTRVDQFASAISTVCEPLLALPLKEISFGKIMLRLLQTAAQFNAQVQPQLILLQKTLINVEGVSRQIYPDVDFFDIARERVEHWIKRNSGIRGLLHEIRKHAPQLATQIPALPELIFSYLKNSVKTNHQTTIIKLVPNPRKFWSGVGVTTLLSGIGLSLALLFIPNFSTSFSHDVGLMISAGMGLFGIACLWLSFIFPIRL